MTTTVLSEQDLEKVKVNLPTTKKPFELDPSRLSIAIYGENRTGKTTFASQATQPIFLATEPGHQGIEGYVLEITTWEEAIKAAHLMKTGEYPYKTIVVDTVTNLYKLCQSFVCRRFSVPHISQVPGFARGHEEVNRNMYNYILGLTRLPYTLIAIMHSKDKTYKTPNGEEFTKVVGDIPDSTRKQLLGLFNFIFFATKIKDLEALEYQHKLRTTYHPSLESGSRFQQYLPPLIDMNYDTFLTEFRRGVTNTKTVPASDKTNKKSG